MRRLAIAFSTLIAVAGLAASVGAETIAPKEKVMLWNGKDFTRWKMFVKDPAYDVTKTWTIKDGVIHCTGTPSGYLRTVNDYANYKIHVEYRWADPDPKIKRNTGVLVHMSEPDAVWPKSIECQGMMGNAGDFYVIEGTDFREHRDLVAKEQAKEAEAGKGVEAAKEEGKAKEGGKAQSAGKEEGKKGGKAKAKGPTRRVPKMAASSEKPLGEWNTYEVTCKDNTITVTINGVLQNKATETNVSSGKILLQSEGGAIEFRNIYLDPAP